MKERIRLKAKARLPSLPNEAIPEKNALETLLYSRYFQGEHTRTRYWGVSRIHTSCLYFLTDAFLASMHSGVPDSERNRRRILLSPGHFETPIISM